MADRRRVNGPAVATTQPIYSSSISNVPAHERPVRTRKPAQPRKIFLQTGTVLSASGSAYLELEPSLGKSSTQKGSTLKLICAVYGPKALPRSTNFSPQLVLNTHLKYAPFATRSRRGFLRDTTERDMSAHLEAALRGVVIGDRWPKSSAEITVTVLEGEDDDWAACSPNGSASLSTIGEWGNLNVLAGCITAASAALVEAGIDCVDLVSGGCAAVVSSAKHAAPEIVVDPNFAEHSYIHAACLTGYLSNRDEVVEMWMSGEGAGDTEEKLVDKAVAAAQSSQVVLTEVLRETIGARLSTKAKIRDQPEEFHVTGESLFAK